MEHIWSTPVPHLLKHNLEQTILKTYPADPPQVGPDGAELVLRLAPEVHHQTQMGLAQSTLRCGRQKTGLLLRLLRHPRDGQA